MYTVVLPQVKINFFCKFSDKKSQFDSKSQLSFVGKDDFIHPLSLDCPDKVFHPGFHEQYQVVFHAAIAAVLHPLSNNIKNKRLIIFS